jgi:rod shape determining protein RodA
MFDRRLLLNFDFSLLFVVLLIASIGILNLYSISSSMWEGSSVFFYRQIYWTLIGLIAVLFIITFNYINLIKYSYYLHAFSLLLLLFIVFFGKTKFGSQRWIYIGPLSLQPSEFAKITFMLMLAKFYAENISLKPFKLSDLIVPFSVLIFTFLLIYIQPDLGTAGIFFLIFTTFFCFIKIKRRSLYLLVSLIFLSLPFFWFILKDYQKKRILMFFNPELDPLHAGYQVIQSKIAVGSGHFLGKGFTLGTQSQLRFLPEQHTDFVFSVWAEEWGFLGCVFLLLLFLLLLYRGLSIALNSKNISGSFLAAAIVLTLFWQILINIGMTIGLFPVVGVPLPFFSYGGSSMLSNMIAIGFLLNINMRKFKY